MHVEPKSKFSTVSVADSTIYKVVFNLKLLLQTYHLKAVTSRIKLATCGNRRLSWVMIMITVSSITKNTGRYAMIYRIFYIPVNFAFNLPHCVTSYMHHTGKKERKKRFKKKEKKIKRLRKIGFKGIRTRMLRIS